MRSSSAASRQSLRLLAVGLALGMVGVSWDADGQTGVQWYPLDGSPAGTPPSIVMLPTSTPQQTDLDITLHGFYFETVTQAGQTFRRLTLDGTRDGALYRTTGRPELPAVHHTLGSLLGTSVGTPAVQVLDVVTVPGAVVYPAQPLRCFADPAASFQWDQAFYQQTTQPYPAAYGAAVGYLGRLNRLDLVGAETYPIRAVPGSQQLVVARHYQVSIMHPGSGTPATLGVSRRQSHQYAGLLDNAALVGQYRPPSVVGFAGDYLIIVHQHQYDAEVQPLAEQKRRRGYTVSVVSTDDIGTGAETCDEIQTYISDWWDAGTPARDHYVLLVGEQIPACTDPFGRSSDRPYACVEGADSYPEIRLGRLPCSSASEAADMVSKTLAYEDAYPGWFVGGVLLTRSQDVGIDEATWLTTYEDWALTPTFTTLLGSAGATDAQVQAEINAGKGVVSYFGSGSVPAWEDWNGGDFNVGDLLGLTNDGKTPVVFSFTPYNSSFEDAGCLGVQWMETTRRAVAHYGSMHCPAINLGNVEIGVFRQIYDRDNVILGEALADGEAFATHTREGLTDVWPMELLGDPELQVWREPPGDLPADFDRMPREPEPGVVEVRIGALAARGARASSTQSSGPIPFAIVSLYKPGEFAESRYTDSSGVASVPISPTSPGWIYMTVYTEFGSNAVTHDSIQVVASTGVRGPGSTAPSLRLDPVAPNPTRGDALLAYALAQPGSVRLTVMDVHGRLVATLLDGFQEAGTHRAHWNGRGRDGSPVGPGIYFARLQAGGEQRRARLAVLR